MIQTNQNERKLPEINHIPGWFYASILVSVAGAIIIVVRLFEEGKVYLAGASISAVGLLSLMLALGRYFKDQ